MKITFCTIAKQSLVAGYLQGGCKWLQLNILIGLRLHHCPHNHIAYTACLVWWLSVKLLSSLARGANLSSLYNHNISVAAAKVNKSQLGVGWREAFHTRCMCRVQHVERFHSLSPVKIWVAAGGPRESRELQHKHISSWLQRSRAIFLSVLWLSPCMFNVYTAQNAPYSRILYIA